LLNEEILSVRLEAMSDALNWSKDDRNISQENFAPANKNLGQDYMESDEYSDSVSFYSVCMCAKMGICQTKHLTALIQLNCHCSNNDNFFVHVFVCTKKLLKKHTP